MSTPYRLAVIPGDGIGPEVVEAELTVLEAAGLSLDYTTYPAGDDCLARTGEALPEETLKGALDAQAVIFGAAGDSAAEVIIRLRSELGTFVNLRPVKAVSSVECLYPDADMMIVRENSECLYSGIENRITPGVVTATLRFHLATCPASPIFHRRRQSLYLYPALVSNTAA